MRAAAYRISLDKNIADSFLWVVSFTILMWLGAFLRVRLPFTPVPITMQTFFMYLAGGLIGTSLAVSSQLGYIALGVLGLPVFTGAGAGLLYLAGPTGGYLMGFVLGAGIIGKILSAVPRRSMPWYLIAFAIGGSVMLFAGASWLVVVLGFGIKEAFMLGVVPFVFGEALKIGLAISVCRVFYQRLSINKKEGL